jgi:uncharacterized protein YndB with AHSA1/START domain
MRIHETFAIRCPPEAVFAFIADPAMLQRWQTIKTHVTPLTDGPTRLGSRFREGNKISLRRWEQEVEVTEFEPGRVFAVRVTHGPNSRGRWTLEPQHAGSTVGFDAEFTTPRLLAPIAKHIIARQFRRYHQNLRRELESPRADTDPHT